MGVSVQIVIPTPDFETKARILHAIDRPVCEMSLEELCEKAQVSKQTFYKHFDSKNAVGLWYSNFCGEHFLYQIGRRYTWCDGLSMHFSMLCQEAEHLRHTSGGTVRSQLGGEAQVTARERWRETLNEKGVAVTREMAFYVESFAATLVNATRQWLLSERCSAENVGEYVGWLENCVPSPFHEAMDQGLS
jgi:AcrR family transcriptional regulator